mmetsp:Transcript_2047/g.4779  ORF Transcript_2047/g.4779 Transcript_2047/m.4779 type:complete len:227 (+) Transcript_2047:442-1122(+)
MEDCEAQDADAVADQTVLPHDGLHLLRPDQLPHHRELLHERAPDAAPRPGTQLGLPLHPPAPECLPAHLPRSVSARRHARGERTVPVSAHHTIERSDLLLPRLLRPLHLLHLRRGRAAGLSAAAGQLRLQKLHAVSLRPRDHRLLLHGGGPRLRLPRNDRRRSGGHHDIQTLAKSDGRARSGRRRGTRAPSERRTEAGRLREGYLRVHPTANRVVSEAQVDHPGIP